MVAASAESRAVVAYMKDLGTVIEGEVYADSSAALGITQRIGIGKVRHLRTQGLWIQETRVAGRLSYRKVLGTKNPADIRTKHVSGDLLDKHLETIRAVVATGRAEVAPQLNSIESQVCWYLCDGELSVEEIESIEVEGEIQTKVQPWTKFARPSGLVSGKTGVKSSTARCGRQGNLALDKAMPVDVGKGELVESQSKKSMGTVGSEVSIANSGKRRGSPSADADALQKFEDRKTRNSQLPRGAIVSHHLSVVRAGLASTSDGPSTTTRVDGQRGRRLSMSAIRCEACESRESCDRAKGEPWGSGLPLASYPRSDNVKLKVTVV